MKSPLFVFAATMDPFLSYGGGWIGNWTPGIGDPTFLGWVTVFSYLGVSLASFRVRRRMFRIKNPTPLLLKERNFWGVFALILFCLCLNKQLDLQTAVTEFLREVAKEQGWYRLRFLFQVGFIAAMAVALPVSGWYVFQWSRPFPPAVKRAGLGLCFIAVFILIRAASFHHIDRLLGESLFQLSLNWLFELGGLAIIYSSTRQRRRELRRPVQK